MRIRTASLSLLFLLSISTPALLAQAPGGLLWRYPDAGSNWVPKTVSIGAQGTQVFTQNEFGNDRALLFSGFDQGTASPVWENPVNADAANAFVDSAEATDTHVAIHQIVFNNNQSTKQSVVSKYASGSSTPDWTYTFPTITSGGARVAISDDGQKIVAVSINSQAAKLQIAIFGPDSGTPTWFGELNNFGFQLVGFDLSADGSTLYVSSQTGATIWNTGTHAPVWQIIILNAIDCQAISGDGSVFAYGGFNFMDVWERNGAGGYTKTHTRNVTGSWLCGHIDISADGSTLAYAWNGYGENNDHVRIEAIDVATKQTTMSDEAVGTGTLQNICSDIAICRDGSRFVAGLWGDEGNVCPELRLYKRNQNAPAALYNLPGSVFDVDISGDGKRVAAASKAVHANLYASGGEIDYYAFDPMDFRGLGVPRVGASMNFQLFAGPSSASSPAILLSSPHAAVQPFITPNNIGVLYLERSSLSFLPMGTTDASGFASASYTLPTGASNIGAEIFFQGFTSSPRRLTRDWARVIILP